MKDLTLEGLRTGEAGKGKVAPVGFRSSLCRWSRSRTMLSSLEEGCWIKRGERTFDKRDRNRGI